MATQDFYPGQRKCYDGNLCTVRWIGEVTGTKGTWLGVEWDNVSRGKHDGEHNGTRYFTCASKSQTAASFIRPNRQSDAPRGFVQAVREKYAYDEDSEGLGLKALSRHQVTYISGKQAEEVGFDKVRQQLANLKALRIILVDSMCIAEPEARVSRSVESISNIIGETCPRITDLNISRNLFESWSETLEICRQLKFLQSLRADGLRLSDVQVRLSQATLQDAPFTKLADLSLEDTLIPWQDIVNIASSFTSLKSLSVSGNEFSSLPPTVPGLPHSLVDLILERNEFCSFDDLAHVLAGIPNLRNLSLKSNQISSTTKGATLPLSTSLVNLDLAYNQISSFALIDSLHDVFPNISSLRVAHNPLYTSLRSTVDGKSLTADDGFILTLARMGKLQTLNYSNITDKERLNAETFYLSQISAEISAAGLEQKEQIVKRHRRFAELCDVYGDPTVGSIEQQKSDVDPDSLAAGLCKCRFTVDEAVLAKVDCAATLELELPKSLSVYAVLALLGRALKFQHPMLLELVWLTDQVDVSQTNVVEGDDLGNFREETRPGPGTTETRYRTETLVPRTRKLGSWLEDGSARIAVRWSEIHVERRNAGPAALF